MCICDCFLSVCVRINLCLYLSRPVAVCVYESLYLLDCWLVLWAMGNSLQISQSPRYKHKISHHWLQCEISLAADLTPTLCPGSLEQIVIRDNWLVLKRSCTLSTFNSHLTLKWEPICMLCVSVSVCAVCCVAVRNCLECRQRHRERGNKSSIPNNNKTQEILQNAATSNKVHVTSLTCPKSHNFAFCALSWKYYLHIAFYCENTSCLIPCLMIIMLPDWWC